MIAKTLLQKALRLTLYTIGLTAYLIGFGLIDNLLENTVKIILKDSIILTYYFFGIFILYYLDAISRQNTRSLFNIIRQDLQYLKNGIQRTVKSIRNLFNALFTLIKWLVILGAIILIFILLGWGVASMSATTIIIVLLVLILLK